MVKAELEKTLTKDVEDKSAQNGQKTSISTQIGDTINIVGSIISELRNSQNGDAQGNAIANQLISSLTEIRGNTLRKNPVIVWQNPRILLRGTSVIEEPERTPVKGVSVTREKTKSRIYYEKRTKIISVSELSNIISVSWNRIIQAAKEQGIKLQQLNISSGGSSTFHISIKDAQFLSACLIREKFDDRVFGTELTDDLISIQKMADEIKADVGSVLEVAGRLSIPIEERGNQRLINRNFAEKIKALTEQRAAFERLARYSLQQDEDLTEEIKGNGNQITQEETESLGEYVSAEQFYKTIGMTQTAWSSAKSRYPEVRTMRSGRFKFFSKEDAEKIIQIRQLKKAEREAKKEKSKRLTAPPEGYVSQNDFLKIIGINSRQSWHQIKNRFSVPTMLKVGGKIYYLKTDADLIKAQRYVSKSIPSPRTFTEPKLYRIKPVKAEKPIVPVTIAEFAASHNLEIGKILEIARSHFKWSLNEPFEQLSSRQRKLLSFYIESNLKTVPEGFMAVAQICKTLGISSSAWYALKAKSKLTSYKIGNGTFYKEEDVNAIAKDRQQKANGRMAARLERKPKFDQEFEGILEGSEEQNSRDLDLFSLHLAEVGQIPIEIKKHKLWGAKISSGQFAVRVLEDLSNSNLLDSSQKRQIEQILETSRAKYFSKEFKLLIKSKLEKEKNHKISPSDIKFLEVLNRHDLWFDRLRVKNIPQVIEHQIKLFNSGSEAFDNLVTSNMRLVISIARKYLWSGFSLPDLEGYGDEGLMKAAIKFDWRKGRQFSTYAVWWIRQTILRAIEDHSDTIRIPVHMYQKISKLKKEADKLLQEGEDIDMEELANKIDPTGNLAKSLQTRNLASLNYAVGPNENSFLEDFLEDVRSNMEENSDRIGMRDAVREALDTLTLREKRVLELRYGLVDGKARSLDQVAADLDKEGFDKVTRERIRQIESNALRKLRRRSTSRKLRPYLDDDSRPVQIDPGQINS